MRLRPAWEDLRSYLTARGRKRFEVYVCTMAERDYALEMWRLLDPDSNLINSKELLARIVCVKSGERDYSFWNLLALHLCSLWAVVLKLYKTHLISPTFFLLYLLYVERFKEVIIQCLSRWSVPSKDGVGD